MIKLQYIVHVAACAVPTVATVERRRMRIVRRSHSSGSTTLSGLGKWGDEGGCIARQERGGSWGGGSWLPGSERDLREVRGLNNILLRFFPGGYFFVVYFLVIYSFIEGITSQ